LTGGTGNGTGKSITGGSNGTGKSITGGSNGTGKSITGGTGKSITGGSNGTGKSITGGTGNGTWKPKSLADLAAANKAKLDKLPPNQKKQVEQAQAKIQQQVNTAKKPTIAPDKSNPEKRTVKQPDGLRKGLDQKGLQEKATKDPGAARLLTDLKAGKAKAKDAEQHGAGNGLNLVSPDTLKTAGNIANDPTAPQPVKDAVDRLARGRGTAEDLGTLKGYAAGTGNGALMAAYYDFYREKKSTQAAQNSLSSLQNMLANLGGILANAQVVPGGAILPPGPGFISPLCPSIWIPNDPGATIDPDALVQSGSGCAMTIMPSPAPQELLTSEPGQAVTPEVVDNAVVPQTTRSLRVANGTDQAVTFYVQYLADDGGTPTWFPAAGPVGVEIAAGETADIVDNDWRVNAAKVRIWAKAGDREWVAFKDKDLDLVPEPYAADAPEVFQFTVR
jgi:hypothetical protein